MQDISVPGRFAQAHAVSGDGTVVVGQGDPDGGGDGAFRWTQAGGMVRLTMPPGWYGSSAEGVSADGSVVAGLASNVQDGGGRAFRWTNAGVGGGTVEILGTLPTTCDPSYAESVGGISADGSVIAGDSTIDSASCNGHAFRWISDGLGGGTIEDLGVLPYQYASQSVSYGLSANGAVVVGQGDTDDYPQAFRWTSATGMQDIGLALTGSISHPSFASGANADGSVVVGYYDSVAFHDDRPLLWTTALGSVDLQEHLASLGVDTTEWSLQFAQGVSADGLTIVG
jgi:probable HAF family extracellular repeat protein